MKYWNFPPLLQWGQKVISRHPRNNRLRSINYVRNAPRYECGQKARQDDWEKCICDDLHIRSNLWCTPKTGQVIKV